MRKRIDILLVDDGSRNFLSPVNFVKDLPISASALPKSTVTLLSIADPKLPYDYPMAEAVLEQMQFTLKDKSVVLDTRIETGQPEEEVIKVARQTNPDLIVMRRHKDSVTSADPADPQANPNWERLRWPILYVNPHYKAIRNVLLITGPADRACVRQFLSRIPFPQKSDIQSIKLLSQGRDQQYNRERYAENGVNEFFTRAELLSYLEEHSFDLIIADEPCVKKLFAGRKEDFLYKLRKILSQGHDPFSQCSFMIVKGNPKPIAKGCGSEKININTKI
jgi:hypothetical protein